MKDIPFEILSQRPLTADVMHMELSGDTGAITAPGQFVNIRLDGFYLRRPISVCDYSDGHLTLVYKVVGNGTAAMRNYPAGTILSLLTGLGNGYDLSPAGDVPLLLGGGVGVPPLYHLCRRLVALGKTPTVILGFGSKSEVFFEQEFSDLGARVLVTTADGSYGQRGLATDAMKDLSYSYLYTCGPEPMLKAVYETSKTGGQFSFEERMGCGFGACMGCSCKTKYGNKRICKDGPVLKKEEIIW